MTKKILILFWTLLFTLLGSIRLNAFTPPNAHESFVYPSPASGNFAFVAFQMAESGQAHLLVYNEAGSLVIEQLQSFPVGVQQFGLQNFLLANGAYVYRVYLNYDSGNSEKLSGKFAVLH